MAPPRSRRLLPAFFSAALCGGASLVPVPAAALETPQPYDAIAPQVLTWSQDPNLDVLLNDTLAWLQTSPVQDLAGATIWGSPAYTKPPQDFPVARLVDSREEGAYSRLFVESPTMRRVVELQVLFPADRSTPAPMLYLLDGASADFTSGWVDRADLQQLLRGEHVMAVMPLGASGTVYADWHAEDPILGWSQWETFLTKELPPLLEATFPFNGERYIGGLSMGGTAAARIANFHPELYAGMFSFSGCYSTTTVDGWALHDLIVRPMGGDLKNMWTPQQRADNDVLAHPEGLAAMRSYIFSGDGVAGGRDVAETRAEGAGELAGSVLLEKIVYRCTRELEAALEERGLRDQVEIHYQSPAVHHWRYYRDRFPEAWRSISQGKYTRPDGRA